ncbi:MAG: hypothetical protein HOY79_07785 [Streptomyces sp.]|nr:hypothetical protein [Streptomyces sp.]
MSSTATSSVKRPYAARSRTRCADAGSPALPGPRLTPRELDVLAQVALGCNNAETGLGPSLLPETVKSYLRSAMRKHPDRAQATQSCDA